MAAIRKHRIEGKYGARPDACIVHRDGPWHDAGAYFWRSCGMCGETFRMRAHPAVASRDATEHLAARLCETDLEVGNPELAA